MNHPARISVLVALGCISIAFTSPAHASKAPPCAFPPSALNASTNANVSQGRNQSTGLASVAYRTNGPVYDYLSYWCSYFAGHNKLEVEVNTPFPESLYTDKRQQVQENARQFVDVDSLAANAGLVWIGKNGTRNGLAYVGNNKVLLSCGKAPYSLTQVAKILTAVVDHLPH